MALRIGIIGNGNIARAHAAGYKELGERVEFVACCDLDEERARKFAQEFGFSKYYTDCNEMLAENELDAVSVCTWNSAHAECSIAALNAGCHVICEKPMAMNTQEALAMKEAAEQNGKILMIGFVRRHGNDAKAALELIDSGQVGEIYYAKASYLRRCGFPGGWFGDKSRSGGGPLIDLGVHVIDLSKYLMGNVKPVSVYGAVFDKLGPRSDIKGEGGWRSATRTMKPIFDVENLATAMIRFENGAILQVETSFNLNIKAPTTNLEFFGDKAGMTLSPLELHTVVENRLADISFAGTNAFDFMGSFKAEILNFVDAVEGKAEPLATAQDGVDIMKIIDAIYLSAETGEAVKLD